MVDPQSLGLPHKEWRAGQLDAYLKIKNIIDTGGGTAVIEAPTGTGKSGIATAISADNETVVLAHNIGLLKQYERIYGFDIIMGRQEYPCVLKQKVDHWKEVYGLEPKASDCHFKNMYECPASSKCPYVIAREKAMNSKRMACTYKYAALSEWVQDREGVVVMDEAHDCYEELIEFSKFTLDEKEARDFKFGKLPLINFGNGGKGDILEGMNASTVQDWISECMKKVSVIDLFSGMSQEGSKNQKMFERLSMAMNMLSSGQTLFYKCAVPTNDDDDWSKPYTTMELRTLDVKDVVERIMGNKDTTVMMSATIGNPKPLMTELGIPYFKFFSYDHPVPKEYRPIYDLGFERMNKTNLDAKPALYKQQAEVIANFIQTLNPDWRGVILTTSNYKIDLLRKFLKHSLGDRIMIPRQGTRLNDQISMFVNNKEKGKLFVGTIQGWGSGLSLDGDIARIAVIAGVPFSNPGDRFSALRMKTESGKQYAFWNAYCSVVQATGRVSRGEKDKDGNYLVNVSALADGNATTPIAKGNYSKWVREAIIPVKK